MYRVDGRVPVSSTRRVPVSDGMVTLPKLARGLLGLDHQGHVPGLQALFLVATPVRLSYTVCTTPPSLLVPSELTLPPATPTRPV